MTIKELQDRAHQTAIEHGWHDSPRSVGDLICLMHTELSEAFEEHRNHHAPDEVYFNPEKPEKPEGIPVELADTVIRIMDFCGRFNINLEKEIIRKMNYNDTRSHRHGGKKL